MPRTRAANHHPQINSSIVVLVILNIFQRILPSLERHPYSEEPPAYVSDSVSNRSAPNNTVPADSQQAAYSRRGGLPARNMYWWRQRRFSRQLSRSHVRRFFRSRQLTTPVGIFRFARFITRSQHTNRKAKSRFHRPRFVPSPFSLNGNQIHRGFVIQKVTCFRGNVRHCCINTGALWSSAMSAALQVSAAIEILLYAMQWAG